VLPPAFQAALDRVRAGAVFTSVVLFPVVMRALLLDSSNRCGPQEASRASVVCFSL